MRGFPVRCWLNSGVSARAGLCASPPFDETVGKRRYMNPSEIYQFTNLHGNLQSSGLVFHHGFYGGVDFPGEHVHVAGYFLSFWCQTVGFSVFCRDLFYPFFVFHLSQLCVDHIGVGEDSEFFVAVADYPVACHGLFF
jgi:hypothetical protein